VVDDGGCRGGRAAAAAEKRSGARAVCALRRERKLRLRPSDNPTLLLVRWCVRMGNYRGAWCTQVVTLTPTLVCYGGPSSNPPPHWDDFSHTFYLSIYYLCWLSSVGVFDRSSNAVVRVVLQRG
jgi:hypothetical protein